ncbi:S24 family peptidase [Halomonas sp. C22]|uniref:S24 family peptidase n=1 Tax=Halomonas sp. C22 TaxID=2580567 RepID=UPI001642C927|nr:helix-turn-helix transcriptional regulator [Halomonas sp. C22]
MTIGDRVKRARKHAGLNQRELAKAIGITQPSLSELERGESRSSAYLVQIASVCGVDASWLATGSGEMLASDARRAGGSDEIELHNTEVVEGGFPLAPDEVELPCFREVEFSAGDGRTQVVENGGHTMRFPLAKLAARSVSPENAACATATGTSMMPTIADGSPIAIDKGTRHIIDGKIYALDHGGMLRIKRLYKLPLGRVRLVSDNSDEYPEETHSLMGPDAPKIIGRVFWWEVFD